jgi:hypothetical protein
MILLNIYYVSFLFSSICAIFRFRELDASSKIFSIYVWVSSLNEIVAIFFAKHFHTNISEYDIYCLIEFGLVSVYFNSSIDVFKEKNIGYYVGAVGIILGMINMIFIQGLYILSSYFLVFEGIFIIAMGLFSFFRQLLKNDQLQLHKFPHFWFTTILVFTWSFTFMFWSLYNYFSFKHDSFSSMIENSIHAVGILFYCSISCVFIFYPKMRKSHE